MPRTHSSNITSLRVGKEVRQARQRAGLTQAQMAERLGVTPPYVSGVESGQRNLTLGALAQIADALGTDLDIRFPEVTGEYERLDEELAARGIEVGRR